MNMCIGLEVGNYVRIEQKEWVIRVEFFLKILHIMVYNSKIT